MAAKVNHLIVPYPTSSSSLLSSYLNIDFLFDPFPHKEIGPHCFSGALTTRKTPSPLSAFRNDTTVHFLNQPNTVVQDGSIWCTLTQCGNSI